MEGKKLKQEFLPVGVIGFFSWPNPSSQTGPGINSSSNRNEYQVSFGGVKLWLVNKADSLTSICELIVWKMYIALTSHNPVDLRGLLKGEVYLFSLFF
jgi:hypothetical protein